MTKVVRSVVIRSKRAFPSRRLGRSPFSGAFGMLGQSTRLGLLGCLAATASFEAKAQVIDLEPPLPNVLLILDTSSSMEKMIDSTMPSSLVCDPSGTKNGLGSPNGDANRWTQALQALTGDIKNRTCLTTDRSTAAFKDMYSIGGRPPPDYKEETPYHRPLSLGCGLIPGKMPGAALGAGVGSPPRSTSPQGKATDFFAGGANQSIVGRPAVSGSFSYTDPACDFNQEENGALDSAKSFIRFGFFSFDTETSPATGVTTGSSPLPLADPFAGTWSYYNGWDSGGTSGIATGRLFGCTSPINLPLEVGARNAAAPPWEGRMMYFPAPDATVAATQSHNANIQQVINAIRPFGPTPIAGSLQDAKYFFWGDPKGPSSDGYVSGGCRDEYIVMITDGLPSLDLRPGCSPEGPGAPDGKCPYPRPIDSVSALRAGSDGTLSGRPVSTYVVGYALESIDTPTGTTTCAQLATSGGFDALCSSEDPGVKKKYGQCCILEKAAIAGGTDHAYFASSSASLKQAMDAIVANIGRKATTRTTPSYSPAVSDPGASGGEAAQVFYSSFKPLKGTTWAGSVTRTRYVCNADAASTPATVDEAKGDDFAANLNSGVGSKYPTRQFLVVEPPPGVKTSATMRTADVLAGDDLLTVNGASLLSNYSVNPPITTLVATCPNPLPPLHYCYPTGGGGIRKANQNFSSDTNSLLSKMTVDPEDFQNGCPNLVGNQYLPWQNCRDQIGRFIFGLPATGSNPSGFRAPASRENNKFSDIYHATPLVVGPPNAFIRDDSYSAFKEAHNSQSPSGFRRPTILYAATNDGLLHGFDTSVDTKENNEIFAVLIPAAVPKLPNLYPSGHAQILDGAPVARDVVFDRTAATQSLVSNWHSVLVAGFGGGGRGYYAVEITTPVDNPATPNVEVPKFLWQLTSTSSAGPTREIFGQNSATPAITTVYIADSFGVKHEVGVAILPGGYEEAAVPGVCDRDTRNLAGSQGKAAESEASALATAKTYRFRSKVPCWSGNSARGRSLSVVRIGTGEIIRTFLPTTHSTPGLEVAAPLGVTTIDTPIDSPLTGVPMVYPSQPGSVAQRVYVGDTDGAIWKFNISDPNPDNWTGGLFFDTINTESVPSVDLAYNAGQPIQLPPTMAFDRLGNVVLGVATGDQETFNATGTNFVYSITDYVRAGLPSNLTSAVPNWHLKFLNGQRVSGPMAVFNSIMYFATFAPLAPGSQSCNAGTPRLWGRDFVKPEDATARDLGGAKRFNPSNLSPVPDYYEPPSADNKIIPGVTISITPTCADTSESASDEFVPKSTHYKMKKVFSGQTSLLAQVGGQDATGKLLKVEVALPSNANPTLIDSWASVLE